MTEELRVKNEEIIMKNADTVCTKIRELLESIPPDDFDFMRTNTAERLIFEALLWGSSNEYEAVGICEVAKKNFINIGDEIQSEKQAKNKE
ncbi:MAG: hypothetical protein ACKVJK_17580 [Methylophagaceae bacterium]|jgi:hypothetical protein|tara:strand:+ start:2225 stop:2497 length:273 start_codon:yes stop_codon:yes gene_type:complete